MNKDNNKEEQREAMGGQIIQINEGEIQAHVDRVVRDTVEETLNALLDAEADKLCQALRYERNPERKDTRAGHYKRKLLVKAGEVELKVPKLRHLPFETAIIERYRRKESSVEEALMEMYLAGVSVRRVEDVTEVLWGTKVSAGTISNLNKRVYERINEWRQRAIEGQYPYIYLDGIYLKRCWSEEVRNVSILVCVGVSREGYRDVLGVMEGAREDYDCWLSFLRHLKERGLKGVKLTISDKCLGLVQALHDVFPESQWQRCVVHFYRNVFTMTPNGRVKEVAKMLKAIHAQEDRQAAEEKIGLVVNKLKQMRLYKAARLVQEGTSETLSFYGFPAEHQRHLRTNNPLERVMREIRRRTRVVGSFPDGDSALMLVAARLRYITGSQWGLRMYLNMEHLHDVYKEVVEPSA
jgi:transposase-like protein